MVQRTVKSKVKPVSQQHGDGLVTTDLGGGAVASFLDPFIMVSLYEMAAPTFPPHPHAGFSVATYILPESPIGFFNQDTLGNRNLISPGALHITVAGRGVQHEEQPERLGSRARGYQIWIDHSDADRELAPYALHLAAQDVPVSESRGATVRTVLGASNDAVSPLAPPTSVRLIDVALEPGATFDQSLKLGETAFLLVLEGIVDVAGVTVRAGEAALTDTDGNELSVGAIGGHARFTLFAGAPLKNRRVQSGPFVASSKSQLLRFASEYRAGAFGKLTPFSEQPGWTPRD